MIRRLDPLTNLDDPLTSLAVSKPDFGPRFKGAELTEHFQCGCHGNNSTPFGGAPVKIDASDLNALSRDLGALGAKATGAMFGVYKEAGIDLRDTWRANARETSGTHGRHYPNSITTDMLVGRDIVSETGPDPRLPQGSMGPGFEGGSVNQSPHLDGQRAADEVGPRLERRIDATLTILFDRAGL